MSFFSYNIFAFFILFGLLLTHLESLKHDKVKRFKVFLDSVVFGFEIFPVDLILPLKQLLEARYEASVYSM